MIHISSIVINNKVVTKISILQFQMSTKVIRNKNIYYINLMYTWTILLTVFELNPIILNGVLFAYGNLFTDCNSLFNQLVQSFKF